MTPQTPAEWQRQIDSLAWLRRQFAKSWPNTTFQLEVGGRVALPATNDRGPAR
jgi:hypothetical protein